MVNFLNKGNFLFYFVILILVNKSNCIVLGTDSEMINIHHTTTTSGFNLRIINPYAFTLIKYGDDYYYRSVMNFTSITLTSQNEGFWNITYSIDNGATFINLQLAYYVHLPELIFHSAQATMCNDSIYIFYSKPTQPDLFTRKLVYSSANISLSEDLTSDYDTFPIHSNSIYDDTANYDYSLRYVSSTSGTSTNSHLVFILILIKK